MGNVVSKKKSTREILKILDKSIIQFENNKKNIIKLQTKSTYRIYTLCSMLFLISVFYAYLDNQNLIIFSILPFIFAVSLRFLISIYYNWKLERVSFDLEDMRDQQKDLINKLKSEEDYIQTVELLGKYEDSSLRNSSFSKITQKKKNVVDTVTDLVLGDDPSKMYALICSECHFHNGMIHPDDDLEEYICYNCNTQNKRKKSNNYKNLINSLFLPLLMEVILRVYTLGTREAVQMLNTVLKKDFKGIWHTSIEVYGKEIFFANEIIKTIPDTTIHGLPHTKHNMGITNVSEEEFHLFLQTLEEQFGKNTYDLLRNNCNHFTDTCTSFLVNKRVPNYIMEVHEAALESEVVSKMLGIFFNKPN